MSRRFVTFIGDAEDPRARGGTVFYFLRAGQRAGFINKGWRLRPERLSLLRWPWNLAELIRTRHYGGFQYSRFFLDRLMHQAPRVHADDEVISFFPLFPRADRISAGLVFYIDATLRLLFSEYGFADSVSPRIQRRTLVTEREQYHRAIRVICRSRWAARSLVSDYGIPAEKVHVVPGGANLDEERLRGMAAAPPTVLDTTTLRLGFIGRQWKRKNLRFLLEVAEVLAARGQKATVLAAGFPPEEGPEHPLLRSVGFLDKARDLEGFVRFVRSAHFGALFSHAEAFGLSNREYLRLGVPVLTWDVGGLPDTIPRGMGEVFRAGVDARKVADKLLRYFGNPTRYEELRHQVEGRAREVSWDSAVERFQQIWNRQAG